MRSRLGRIAIVLGVVLVAGSAATPSFAIWPFTRNDKVEDPVPDPVTYTVDIEVVGGSRSFQRSLRNASSLYTRRKTPASGMVGLLARAKIGGQSGDVLGTGEQMPLRSNRDVDRCARIGRGVHGECAVVLLDPFAHAR